MAKKINWKKLGLCVLGCELAVASGAVFTASSVNGWYVTLNKPFYNPPSWIFGPVWTILFALMGISFYLILEAKNDERRKRAISLFVYQFILNVLWSLLFFGLRQPWLAYLDIVGMWILIFLTIKSFLKLNKTAGWLLYPYLAWVSFASLLNLSVAFLN